MFEAVSDAGHYLHSGLASNSTHGSPSSSGGDKDSPTRLPGDIGDKEGSSEPKGTQYLNPNCVLLTYFSGDTATVVDDHFTRALSQPSSYSSSDRSPSESNFRSTGNIR
jgi:hypothetical protein